MPEDSIFLRSVVTFILPMPTTLLVMLAALGPKVVDKIRHKFKLKVTIILEIELEIPWLCKELETLVCSKKQIKYTYSI